MALGPGSSFSIIQNVQTHETMRSTVVVAWVAAHLPLPASLAGGNGEVGKTVESKCRRQ